MNIITRARFKHGRTLFESDGKYDVSDRVGGYLVGVGWAVEAPDGDEGPFQELKDGELDASAPEGQVSTSGDVATLEIDDLAIGVKSKKLGG